MEQYILGTNLNDPTSAQQVDLGLSLVSFIEDGTYIIYSPSLDLSGYGDTEQEAKESFEIALKEFLRYTLNKRTLSKVLKKLGWKVSDKKRKYKEPNFDDLVKKKDYLADIVRDKEFQKINQNFNIDFLQE